LREWPALRRLGRSRETITPTGVDSRPETKDDQTQVRRSGKGGSEQRATSSYKRGSQEQLKLIAPTMKDSQDTEEDRWGDQLEALLTATVSTRLESENPQPPSLDNSMTDWLSQLKEELTLSESETEVKTTGRQTTPERATPSGHTKQEDKTPAEETKATAVRNPGTTPKSRTKAGNGCATIALSHSLPSPKMENVLETKVNDSQYDDLLEDGEIQNSPSTPPELRVRLVALKTPEKKRPLKRNQKVRRRSLGHSC